MLNTLLLRTMDEGVTGLYGANVKMTYTDRAQEFPLGGNIIVVEQYAAKHECTTIYEGVFYKGLKLKVILR